MKKIIFFSGPKEVDEFKKHNRSLGKDSLCIAMTPSAYSRLKENGFQAHNTLEYFTNDSHANLLDKSKVLMDWLRKNSEFIDPGIGIRKTSKDSFIFLMRCVILYSLWTIEVIANAIEAHKPSLISASLCDKAKVFDFFVEPEERYLGFLVKRVSQAKNLHFVDMARPGKNSIWRINYAKNAFGFICRFVNFYLWELTVLAKSKFKKKSPFFLTTKHRLNAVTDIFHNGATEGNCYFLKGPIMASFNIPDSIIRIFLRPYSDKIIRQKGLFKDLTEKIKKEIDLFSHKNISFSEIISQKIKDNVANHAIAQYAWAIKLNRALDRLKPAGIFSIGDRLDDVMLAELCQNKNIQDILISHGSHVRPKNKYEDMEWGEHGKAFVLAPFSFFALQSPLAEGYLDSFSFTKNTVKTGPVAWGRSVNEEKSRALFNKMFNGKYSFDKVKIVLHAGTTKPSKALRLHVYETPDEYIQGISELANAVQKIPDTILIVRFRPRPEINIEDLQRLVPFSEKVILNIGNSFGDMLGMANLLVSFSSTAIEEALQNRIPVLLYGGRGRYQHIEPATQLERDSLIEPQAVYHVKEGNNLEYAIRGILNLDINGKGHGHLFDQYIYAEDSRTSLTDFVSTLN